MCDTSVKEEIKIEELHKEIDLIQGVITRMASNSFKIKGWTVTIYGVVLALLPETINFTLLCVVMLIVTGLFWYLDAYFLKTERIYRKIYDWVIEERSNGNRKLMYQLNSRSYEGEIEFKDTILKTMFSKTIGPFYGTLVVFLFIFLLYSINIIDMLSGISCR